MSETKPLLRTARFALWRPQAGDLAGLVRLIAAHETRRFLGPAEATPFSQFDRLMRNAGGWSLYGYGVALVRPHGSDEIIGTCGVFHSWRGFGKGLDDTPEAGWIVREDWWGHGVARETAEAMLGWFDAAHGPRRIACMIEEGNTASERLAARLGFVEYDREQKEGERALVLYERLPAN